MTLNPGQIRDVLAEADIDVTASSWTEGFVIAAGATIVPCMLRGFLIVNGTPVYSAAWL